MNVSRSLNMYIVALHVLMSGDISRTVSGEYRSVLNILRSKGRREEGQCCSSQGS